LNEIYACTNIENIEKLHYILMGKSYITYIYSLLFANKYWYSILFANKIGTWWHTESDIVKEMEQCFDKYFEWDKFSWYLSQNPNITIEFIEKYIDKPWNWKFLTENPSLTMKFIEKYPDKPWDRDELSSHKFTKEKELFYQKYYRIYIATFRLQQYFNRMYDNPKYLFCRNRLDKLFSE